MKDLNLIRIFLEVIDRRSFTKAAAFLNIPKATASYKVAQLETELGVRLLNRSTRSVTPTPEGLAYADLCRPLLSSLIDATDILEEKVKRPGGVLKVKLPTTYVQWAIAPYLPEFLKAYPDIQLKLIVADDQDIDVFQQGTDLVLHVGEIKDSSLTSIYIAHSIRYLYASQDYLNAHPPLKRIEDLKLHDCMSCIASASSKPLWCLNTKKGKSIEMEVSGRLLSTDYITIKKATVAALGIALMPERICREEVQAGTLVRVLPEWKSDMPEFHALVHPQKLISPKLRVFIDFLKKHPWND